MVLIRSLAAIMLLFVGLLTLGAPAAAHENHQAAQVEAAEEGSAPAVLQNRTADHADAMAEAHPGTWPARLVRWAGHMHPFAVHFPIALIPVSWLALLFARRRGDAVDLIRAFIIVAGAAALGAAALGWLNAGFALTDRNPIQAVHRWIGTGLGLMGAIIALWAWRKAAAVDSRAMVWTLGLLTLVLLVQG
jgi:hypothetical protein